MNTRQIVDRALRLTHTNTLDYNDVQAMEDVNFAYQELVDDIENGVDEYFFWDLWLTDTVVDQSEYVVEKLWIAPDDLDIRKINKFLIKYSTNDTFYTLARFLNPSSLTRDTEWYKVNQPSSDPFWYIQDNSIFIYPAPTTVVTEGIKLECIHAPADLTISSTSDDIEIPTQFHKVISTGLKQYIYQSQGKLNEQQLAIQDFEREKAKMVSFLKERYDEPVVSVMPNLTIYE